MYIFTPQCEYCGKEFEKKPSTKGRFCSIRCYWDSKIGDSSLAKHFGKPKPAWNKGKKGYKEKNEHWCYKKKRPEMTGENHPNWKGGVSREHHGGADYINWRSDIFERDNWTCQTCGVRGTYLEAHHINSWSKYPELRYDLDNGVTLCRECHKLTDNYCGKRV